MQLTSHSEDMLQLRCRFLSLAARTTHIEQKPTGAGSAAGRAQFVIYIRGPLQVGAAQVFLCTTYKEDTILSYFLIMRCRSPYSVFKANMR